MNLHRHVSQLVGACAVAALAATVAACGSSSPSASSTTTPPSTPTTSAPSSPTASPTSTANAASTATITANWEAFFSAKTPVSKRVSLLEDGSQFESVIKDQAGSGLAAAATAKVTNVTVNSSTQATVTYNILEDGQSALSNQKGVAVYQDGTWKVGVASFCGLLSLENSGSTKGLPAACKSAS